MSSIGLINRLSTVVASSAALGMQAAGFAANWRANRLDNSAGAGVPATMSSPWRPPRWDASPQLTSITVLEQQNTAVSHVVNFGDTTIADTSANPTTTQKATPTTYFFDAVLSADHFSRLHITDHPVQNGASIADHAYAIPQRVVLEIGMSDVMDSYVPGQYASGVSKSISAYKKFKDIQKLRIPITLSTRLDQYTNMLIEEIRVPDTNQTVTGLRATIVFKQIRLAIVATDTVSARPDQSQGTNEGSKQPSSVSPALLSSHAPTNFTLPSGTTIPLWSSDPQAPVSLGTGGGSAF